MAAGHPWVFSNEIDTERTPLTALASGAIATVRSHRDAFIGYACVNPHALICARILSRDAQQPVDAALLERRLAAALALREQLSAAPLRNAVIAHAPTYEHTSSSRAPRAT